MNISKIQKDKVPDAPKVDKITAHENCIKCYLKKEIQYNCNTILYPYFVFQRRMNWDFFKKEFLFLAFCDVIKVQKVLIDGGIVSEQN